MSQLENLVHYTYKHLFDINPKALESRDVIQMKDNLPAKVIDDTTFDLIEIPELFKAINHTKTITGAATLFRSLIQPLTSLELIHAKQDSVKELEENVELTYKLNEYVHSLVEKEPYTYRYFYGRLSEYSQYEIYRGASIFFKRLVEGIKDIPKPKTPYLEILLNDIKSIDGTHAIELIKGPVYATFRGLKPRSEVRLFTPRIKFSIRPLKPVLIAPFIAATLTPFFVPVHETAMGWKVVTSLMPLGVFGFFAGYIFPREFDYHCFTLPLRDIYVADKNIRKGIDAIGKIDELLSFYEYWKVMGGEVTMPVVTDNSPHYFVAKEAKNPVLLSKNSYVVPNDIYLNGQKLTFITGPKSGGKTTYSKTIEQIQVEAQIGNYVSAKEPEMSIADRIFYQAPTFDTLKDSEGKFGTESKRTRDILFNCTPKSLVVLDELGEGVTHKETLEVLYDILEGFYIKGNNTILITPHYELANRFRQEGKGQYLQAEFKDNIPTHKLVPGISEETHADVVLEKIGFSRKDIIDHLKKEGYLK